MSGFSKQWLALRAGVDRAARSSGLVARLPQPPGGVRLVTDLGAGTGANLAYLAPLLGGEQIWRLVDNDPALLGEVPRTLRRLARSHGGCLTRDGDGYQLRTNDFACRVRTERLDLLSGIDRLVLAHGELLTASALLDLVGQAWLQRLTQKAREACSPALFALSYDGRIDCWPPIAGDEQTRDLVNRHQHRDKGFGPALGPDAALFAARLFGALGYETECARSDWRIGASEVELGRELIGGWLTAALALAPSGSERAALHAWGAQRCALLGQPDSRLVVGHLDLIAWLA